MKLKFAAALAAICMAAAPAAALGQTQVLNMQNADIRVFIQDMARASGRTIVVDPRVQGTVSVSTNRPMGRDQLFEVLLSTLRANGLVAIPTGVNTYRVTPDEAAASQPSSAGGARTAVVVQNLGDTVEDGHETNFQTERPKQLYRCYLSDIAAGKVPVIRATSTEACW